MDARRVVKEAKVGTANFAPPALAVGLAEHGPDWWNNGAPDWNRLMAKNTPYAQRAAGELRKCGTWE